MKGVLIVANTKTFLPTLRRLLERVCTYIGRWRIFFDPYLTDEGKEAVDNVLVACNALVAILDTIIPPST